MRIDIKKLVAILVATETRDLIRNVLAAIGVLALLGGAGALAAWCTYLKWVAINCVCRNP